ncbi:hypothetical protein NK214_20775 [Chromobacterium sp. S0633]|uniref:hypothetical protein n=1 Tax=Chromobacterium sp. S0633 TaxID=2957805 RepID=UPI00209DA26F|nr:hypothetical protein [Chromobacterium sp. S0633]MCP1292618.1 hypothetical protein [Chromobacterium sp. S0633]
MSNYWDYIAEFKNDIDELLEKIRQRTDELSRANHHIIAAVADEKENPAKGVVFYAPANQGNIQKNNAGWQKLYIEAKPKGDDQAAYNTELFDKIRNKLNSLSPSEAFGAKLLLSDSKGGKATITLFYPTTHIKLPVIKPPIPLPAWLYTCYFEPYIENVADKLNSALNLSGPSFSLLAYSDEDGSDAKGVIYNKLGLSNPELAHVGHAWALKTYSSKAGGRDQATYKAELFDKIKTDLNSLPEQHLLLAQLFLTDRSEGRAHIALLYPQEIRPI